MQNLEKHSRLPRKTTSTKTDLALVEPPPSKPVPLEARNAIIEDARCLIPQGWTLEQISKKHSVKERTLDLWLQSLGDEYKEIREMWIDNLISESGALLKNADDPMELAKARELWKRATWLAERRDRKRYGEDKQQLNVNIAPVLNISIAPEPAGQDLVIEQPKQEAVK